MPTLLLRLIGPMQSWGTASRFDRRDTGKEPSKSAVIGLLAAALGIERENWTDLQPLTRLTFGVRHDRSGIPGRDFQTAQNIISADHSKIHETAVTTRDYLADAAFLVGLEGQDRSLLERIDEALRDPVWPLALGRKSYTPSEPVWMDRGIVDSSLVEALTGCPWIVSNQRAEEVPKELLISIESDEGTGTLRMDQPLSCFSKRRFGARFSHSVLIPFPGEVSDVSQ